MAGQSFGRNNLRDHRPETPLAGQGIPKDIRLAVEQVISALSKSDESVLPVRMDRKCRERLRHEIRCLKTHGVSREIRFSGCRISENGSGKTGWKKSNEGGREWRECTVRCTMTDSLVRPGSDRSIYERYIKDGFVTIIQSRRIRSDDRRKEKSAYYDKGETNICRSCGAEIKIDSEIVICPHCGAYIESNFYDWQLESFEIGRERSDGYLYIGALLLAVLVPVIISLLAAKNWYEGLLPGICAGIILAMLLISVYLLLLKDHSRQIVRYSENTLRKNLLEYLWTEKTDGDVLEKNLESFSVKKVVNSQTETKVTVNTRIQELRYNCEGSIRTENLTKKLKLARARYPDRMKATGVVFEEKECPSCGANYLPDKNGNCSYCGYGLYVHNRNWKVEVENNE